jgi:hypothetical protein
MRFCMYALLVAFLGCSDSVSNTYPVTGTVKLGNGQPLAGGRILFQPTGEASQPARGIVMPDGSFRLTTFETNDGAVAGHHKIMITPSVPGESLDDPAAIARHRSIVNRRYQSLQTTPLEYTVKSDGTGNHFKIVLERSLAASK